MNCKALTGLSPHGYFVTCRIQRAKTAFKLAIGLSPCQWTRASA